ncbi:MAG: DUF3618 domain-containing protein [Bauldia sp.]
MNRESAAAIESDIRATQARIDHTIDSLKTKLSPGDLLNQVLGFVKEEGGEIGHNAYRQVKENPIPLAVMAAAMAWMMMPKRAPDGAAATREAGSHTDWNIAPEHAHHREAIGLHDRVQRAVNEVTHTAGETMEAFNERLHDARAKAMGLARDIGEEAEAFRDRVTGAFTDLSDKATAARSAMTEHMARFADSARTGIGNATHYVADTARKAEGRAEKFFNEQPLVVGAIGMAIGALAGALIPNTRRENELMAGAGKEIRREARAMAETAMETVEDTANRIASDIADVAEEEGVTAGAARDAAGNVIGKAERVAERALDAVEKDTVESLRRMH